MMISNNGKTKLIKREHKGIWQNLYEFPLVESEKDIEVEGLVNQEAFKEIVATNKVSIQLYNKDVIVHKLSHQHIVTKFYILKNCTDNDTYITWKEIDDFPVPKLIHNFIEELKCTDIFSIFE